MIIDDASEIRQVVGHVLTSEGYEVVEASDGADALSKLNSNGNGFDLFICDVNMPNMDGITFLKKLKSDDKYSEYKFSPIIMLTTESSEDMKEECQKAGAKAWLLKPFQPQKVLEAVKKLLPA